VEDIRRDCTSASNIAAKSDLNFSNELNAVYHFRKHGHEFVSKIQAEPIEVYLQHTPAKLVNDANLIQINTCDVRKRWSAAAALLVSTYVTIHFFLREVPNKNSTLQNKTN